MDMLFWDMREGDVLCRLTRNGQSASDAATDGDIERYMIDARRGARTRNILIRFALSPLVSMIPSQ